MQIIFTKATSAVLAAQTSVDFTGRQFDPPPTFFQFFNPSIHGNFILPNTSVPTSLQTAPNLFIVDNPTTPTTVTPKFTAVVTTGAATLVADGSSSTTVTITITDQNGATVTGGTYSGIYSIKVKSSLGFIVNNIVTTAAGVGTTTLIAGHLTGDCVITASPADIQSVQSGSTPVEMTSSVSVTNPNVNNGIQTIGQFLTFTAITAPGNPGNGLGNLYMKTGFSGLFWKPNAGGAEVDLTLGASASGNVTGPVSSTDKAIVRWSGVGGTNIQNSTVTLSDIGDISGIRTLNGTAINITTVAAITSAGMTINDGGALTLQGATSVTMTTAGGSIAVANTGNIISISGGTGNIFASTGSPGNITFQYAGTGKFVVSNSGTTKAQILADTEAVPNNFLELTAGYLQLDNVSTVPTSTVAGQGKLYKKSADGGLYWKAEGGAEVNLTTVGGGNTTGAASSTDTALVRFSGTTGKILQNGTILEDGSGGLTQVKSITGQTGTALQIISSNAISVSATGTANTTVSGSTVTIQDGTAVNIISLSSSTLSISSTANNIVISTTGGSIQTTGNIIPSVDAANNIGSATLRYLNIFTENIISASAALLVSGAGVTLTSTANNLTLNASTGTTSVIVNGGTAAGAVQLTTSGGTGTITSNSPITPTSDGFTSLGTSTVNWSGVFSRLYDSKTGQDVTFNRAGTTLFKLTSSGVSLSASITPTVNNTYNLGTASNVFNNIYCSNLNGATGANLFATVSGGNNFQINTTSNAGFTIGNNTYSLIGNVSAIQDGGTTLSIISNTTIAFAGGETHNVKQINNLPTGGSIGAASITVDIFASFELSQTTASQTITLPSPTSSTAGRFVTVMNAGTVSFTMLGASIAPNAGLIAQWGGGVGWVLLGHG